MLSNFQIQKWGTLIIARQTRTGGVRGTTLRFVIVRQIMSNCYFALNPKCSAPYLFWYLAVPLSPAPKLDKEYQEHI